jgi:hypothetical protein
MKAIKNALALVTTAQRGGFDLLEFLECAFWPGF